MPRPSEKEPASFRFKKFNPIIDMVDQRIIESDSNQDDAHRCLDIEDMTSIGKKHNICPYYLAKSRLPGADIVVIPYQYLLNRQIRR